MLLTPLHWWRVRPEENAHRTGPDSNLLVVPVSLQSVQRQYRIVGDQPESCHDGSLRGRVAHSLCLLAQATPEESALGTSRDLIHKVCRSCDLARLDQSSTDVTQPSGHPCQTRNPPRPGQRFPTGGT